MLLASRSRRLRRLASRRLRHLDLGAYDVSITPDLDSHVVNHGSAPVRVAHRKPDNFSVRQSAVLRNGPFTWLCAALITMALIITTATIVYLLLIDVAFSVD